MLLHEPLFKNISMSKIIELLSPAKDIETARAAILGGADAVYIGAPRFSARAAAGNSIDDLKLLTSFAHTYHVRIYVALNTLLKDEELPVAEEMIWALWRIGVDALIVQDMGITRLNLPPIPLHASTQTDNRTIEKVVFLERAGFNQVVLARELSLEQIQQISAQTKLRLEAFIHGALCVSYSGQCYMSQVMAGRSANRGVCAQYCRLPYDLVDADGKCLMKQQYLLSLKDLQRQSEDLEAMIQAGITSLKIEGRLKDVSYVRNVTAWYRMRLDEIIARHPDWRRSSTPGEQICFTPNPSKSFNRGFTDYFLHGRRTMVYQFATPKSMGEEMGFVRAQKKDHFLYLGKNPLYNGDGISYFNEQGCFDGFRVNRVEADKIYPANPRLHLRTGVKLYRTYDRQFEREMEKPASRRIFVRISCREIPSGFALEMTDAEGHLAALTMPVVKEKASKPQSENIKALLSRSSHPVFQVEQCELQWSAEYFLPLSLWTAQRNRLYELFEKVRNMAYRREEIYWPESHHSYPQKTVSYLGNVLNRQAEAFYRNHGVESIEPALEAEGKDFLAGIAASAKENTTNEIVLMRCKHCLRYALKACPKESNLRLREPLYLVCTSGRFRLQFDCKACEMLVLKEKGKSKMDSQGR